MAGQPEGRAAARGSLRIYLGAAAGVGKTFAMLGEGHRRAERGADVVVGFAETHGRPQTAALLAGLEVVPRARIDYRGASFEEMDVDAVLARKPQIALVDELAHTNVPGSRNEKRWQDVAGTARRRHRRDLRGQHPAPGIAQRRRRADHRGAAAGDHSRLGGARGRPGRARRHDGRGAAPPDGARQHLPAGEDRRGAHELLPVGKPDRAAGAGAAVAGRQGRRRAAEVPRRTRHPHHLGGPRADRRRADRRT